MCMLFGFSSKKEYELRGPMKNFFEYSKEHPDGWGLVLFNKAGKYPFIVKEPMPAYESIFLNEMCKGNIRGRLAIGHIRKKTCGQIRYANTHPFLQRVRETEWVFAHNGSIDFGCIRKHFRKPHGETDSEKISCYIADELERSSIMGDGLENKAKCLDSAISFLAQYGKLNLLITDGQYLYVHSNYKNSLCVCQTKDAIMLATKPVIRGNWDTVPINRLFIFKDGELVYKGRQHSFEHTSWIPSSSFGKSLSFRENRL